MSISGLVITVTDDMKAEAFAAIAHLSEVTLGEPQGVRWPAVLEAADERGAKAVHDRIADTPGVMQVDVVFVAFEDTPLVSLGWRGDRR